MRGCGQCIRDGQASSAGGSSCWGGKDAWVGMQDACVDACGVGNMCGWAWEMHLWARHIGWWVGHINSVGRTWGMVGLTGCGHVVTTGRTVGGHKWACLPSCPLPWPVWEAGGVVHGPQTGI